MGLPRQKKSSELHFTLQCKLKLKLALDAWREKKWLNPTWMNAPTSDEGAGCHHYEATLHYLWQAMVTGVFLRTGRKQLSLYLQERQRRRSRELQADQPHLSLWEADGANLPVNYFQGSKKVSRSSQQRFLKIKSCLTNLMSFYHEMTGRTRGEQWLLFAWSLGRV